jgi:hypothetical protein
VVVWWRHSLATKKTPKVAYNCSAVYDKTLIKQFRRSALKPFILKVLWAFSYGGVGVSVELPDAARTYFLAP